MALLVPQTLLMMQTVAAVGILSAIVLIVRIYSWRSRIASLRAQGLPMPPWNPFIGHLGLAASITANLPRGAHGHYLGEQIRKLYPELGPNFYIDLFPMAPSMLVLSSPDTLYQATTDHSLPKHSGMTTFLTPLTDGFDLVTMEGEQWKRWRKLFNPGFSNLHLMTLVPAIIKETETFRDVLAGHERKGDVLKMKDLTDNLAIDVIGRVVMDIHFNCQLVPSSVISSLRSLVRWLSFGAEPNLLDRYNPFRPLIQWYYRRAVNKFVYCEVESRFAATNSSRSSSSTTKVQKTIMDLALSGYIEESGERPNADRQLDEVFKHACVSQVKLFLFSGHDTTSSSICYALYLISLSQHRKILRRLRVEHDEILTSDPAAAGALISATPTLLNSIPYTTAVLKESLRLFPVVTSTRRGEPGYSVTDSQGRKFSTDGFLVWSNVHTIHHDGTLWPRPHEFLPERWLAHEGDELYPVKGAWRAFEHGPRNCIGQELAMLEMKAVLCLLARTLKVKDIYAEIDEQDAIERLDRCVEGERAYQIQLSQPDRNLPCRIVKAEA